MALARVGPVPVRACVDLPHPKSFSPHADAAFDIRSSPSGRAIYASRSRPFNPRALQSP